MLDGGLHLRRGQQWQQGFFQLFERYFHGAASFFPVPCGGGFQHAQQIAAVIHPALPDEKFRRVGQSAAAASLPELRK